MSKSKGNVLDPIDLIDGIELEALVAKRTTGMMQPQMAEKIDKATRKEFPDGIPAYGTDALRFTFAALASTGRDIKFDLGRIEATATSATSSGTRRAIVLMNTEDQDCGARHCPRTARSSNTALADRWILSRLESATAPSQQGYRQLSLRHRRASDLRIHLERILRLVSGTVQAGVEQPGKFRRRTNAARATPWCTCSKPCCASPIR